jgi:Cu+-exporting ATPase
LAIGFGIQIGLYLYLKQLVHARGDGKLLAVTGTTSTAAMVSCCAHYLVNILPILGVSAFASFVGEYQIQFFWIGIAFNLLGIGFMISRVIKVKKQNMA